MSMKVKLILIIVSLAGISTCSAMASTGMIHAPSDDQSVRPVPGPDDTLYYNQVVVLRTGENLVGRVEYDIDTDTYTIKLKDGGIRHVLRRDVDRVEEYSRVYLPPAYHPTSNVQPCDIRARERQWYFAEVRLWAMYTGEDESAEQVGLPDFLVGPEIAAGFRIGHHWGIGAGATYFSARDISRIPVFIHARYQILLDCDSPFLYAQAGTVFDDQSGDHIALNKIFHPGPKIAGFGIGLDYPIVPWMDLSADIGYRYLQLPTKVPCDCSNELPLRNAIYYNESHGVLLRLGVTF
jgi:hypothetical protein